MPETPFLSSHSHAFDEQLAEAFAAAKLLVRRFISDAAKA